MNLTDDPDFRSPASYGHDLITRSTVNRFRAEATDGRTDGRTDGSDCISLSNAVGKAVHTRGSIILYTVTFTYMNLDVGDFGRVTEKVGYAIKRFFIFPLLSLVHIGACGTAAPATL